MKFFKFLRTIKKSFSRYNPAIEILIFKNNLLHNLHEYQKRYPRAFFAPVLKSNAYGHGLVPVAKIFAKEKIAFFAVDSLYEALVLRNEGIKTKILVIGYTSAENINNSRLAEISFAITGLEQLKEISATIKKAKNFHLKIDTGMHRQGVLPEQLEEAIEIIKNNKFIFLEGACSHLADADSENAVFTKKQLAQWGENIRRLKKDFPQIKFTHISATAGAPFFDESGSNTIRLGLGLYGFDSSPLAKMDLRPALQMQSVISSTKIISADEFVGYGLSYQAGKNIKIATVPVGYFEGVDRRLSNAGVLKIGNNFCPIVGRVSMNITSLDASSAPEVKINDKAVIISGDKKDLNSAENIAKTIGAIPYEILVHLPQHLRRTVIDRKGDC